MSTQSTLPPGFDRFAFVAEALDASGGFAPKVTYKTDDNYLTKPYQVSGPCHLVPYPRESMAKFAARAAVAVYENHLRSACERFVGYMVRKPPQREGADGPLSSKFVADADWAGNALDVFWGNFMIEARARGSMLLLMDMPDEQALTLADQADRRLLPYLTPIKPEQLCGFELDPRGQFVSISINSCETIDGKEVAVVREWNATAWRVLDAAGKVLREGEHPFGRCPVLGFTEHGKFPCVGQFEQIANLSRRVFNAHSELDEILRGQTFSLLTYQVPAEVASTFDAAKVAAVIGTHNMLTHSGDVPAFIAPADGPAKTYMDRIAGLEAAIRRIGLDIEESAAQTAESGIAKQIRFQSLNAALSSFATRMQDFERQMWELFAAATNTENRVDVTWCTDYTLADILAELDKLTAMQTTGFADAVLIEKRKQITVAEFSGLDPEDLQVLLDSLDEPVKEPPTPPGFAPGIDSITDPNLDPNADPKAKPGGAKVPQDPTE